MKEQSPYKRTKNLLTKTEADFLVYLKEAVNGDFHINKMTRMCDLVDVNDELSKKEYMSYFRSISQYHIDFTLCDPLSYKPLICIELDDPSHEREDRIKRDEKVNRIFSDINMPLLRIMTSASYNVDDIRSMIDGGLEGKCVIDERDRILEGKQMVAGIIAKMVFGLVSLILAICLLFFFYTRYVNILISKPDAPVVADTKTRSPTNSSNKEELRQKDIVADKNTNTANETKKDKVKPIKRITSNRITGESVTIGQWKTSQRKGKKIAILKYNGGNVLIEAYSGGMQLEHQVNEFRNGSHIEYKIVNGNKDEYYLLDKYNNLHLMDDSGRRETFMAQNLAAN